VNPPVVDDSTSGAGFKRGLTDLGEPSNFNKETDILPLQSKQNTMWAESSILTGRISGRKFPFRLVELYSPRGQAQTATRGVFRIACALRGVSELVMGAVVNISYRPTFVQRSLSSPCYASIIVCALR